jgi:hypothetical protein
MKSLLIAAVVLLGISSVQAVEPSTVNKSSFIAVAAGTGYIPAEYLDKVIVGMPTASGVLEIFNSTFSTNASLIISSISLASVRDINLTNMGVKGIMWRVTLNTNGVTILYKR